MDQYNKLSVFCNTAIAEIDGVDGEEDYYDEEAAEGEDDDQEWEWIDKRNKMKDAS